MNKPPTVFDCTAERHCFDTETTGNKAIIKVTCMHCNMIRYRKHDTTNKRHPYLTEAEMVAAVLQGE